jgi:hypothetical protein
MDVKLPHPWANASDWGRVKSSVNVKNLYMARFHLERRGTYGIWRNADAAPAL